MIERPENFVLKHDHSLAKGLVFAGLGQSPGSVRYRNSTPYRNQGSLSNMDPPTDWVWVPQLGRWGLDFDGVNDRIGLSILPIYEDWTISLWANWVGINADAFYGLFGNSDTRNSIHFRYTSATQDSAIVYIYFSDYSTASWGFAYNALALRNIKLFTWRKYNNTYTFFINGTSRGNQTSSQVINWQLNMFIGGVGNRYYNGMISDVLVYNRAIDNIHISQLADPSNAMLSGMLQPPKRKYYGIKYSLITDKLLIFKQNNKFLTFRKNF